MRDEKSCCEGDVVAEAAPRLKLSLMCNFLLRLFPPGTPADIPQTLCAPERIELARRAPVGKEKKVLDNSKEGDYDTA